jgi:hypothetical protein
MTTKTLLLRRGPHCAKCGLQIGNGVTECGYCRNPKPLSFRELLRMGRLVRDHWHGVGGLPGLIRHPSYRPAFTVTERTSLSHQDDKEYAAEIRQGLAERAELADLYDRSQGQREVARRAVRI